MLFINSIASQMLTDNDVIDFVSKYQYMFDRVVFEIIEEDFGGYEVFKENCDNEK